MTQSLMQNDALRIRDFSIQTDLLQVNYSVQA